MTDCLNCEYHRQRAQRWRDEAYKLSGHPLPEREPVAFASHGVVNWIADKQFQHEADLYTIPQQRTWVGLTELEKAEITSLKWWDWEDTFDIEGFIRAIEAKLKEKNGA